MLTLLLTLVIGIVALAPGLAAAQVSSGAPGSTKPNSPLEGSGSPGAGSPSASGTSTTPGASSGSGGATTAPGGSSSSPSASPSQPSDDLAKYTTPGECETAGGAWLMATNRCVRK
jgi:resuscitation-promoting factor RpfA